MKEEINRDEVRTLYDKLGGNTAIRAVVNEFYDRMINDPVVSSVFDGVDLVSLRKHQAQFLAYALGGPVKYDGSTLRESHTGLNITDRQYEATIRHLNATLRKLNVELEDRAKIEAFIRSVKPFIINQ
ncbi:group 1 truncated hemoglobin GlbN [Kroppenstedtia guangzhouensis]|uniref:Group 1 truncated hemoglobin n=1 Tax=Kroppenstedtia guangzhouensis TaxID=1274356 RepID=A0ABQ1GIH7_9BACL|nr:group 1 truncated hemoglobin [Kroppenstedtia guangzhouensis]GGA44481.1 group 1 truncated hemoglobin GlbN [Kroppenstedtia guangzhouensis]